ncbi:MAG: transglutaminase family protein [Bdellovibrionales bacterium]|nr:transglutaminase family protein [Ramlibacter sp.]
MLLRVIHETLFDYVPAVKTAQHVAHLRPCETPLQKVLQHTLTITPEPAQRSESVDIYGNLRTFFSLQSRHEELKIVADSLVMTSPPPSVASVLTWEQVREHFRYRRGAVYDPAAEFLFASPYVPRHQNFLDYASPSFTGERPLLEAARDLMTRIYTDFTYETEVTEVSTPALESLELRKGVCQDFAHIMVACLRTMGLPARYVSGYLLTEPPPGHPRLVGADASHAWVSVYVPPAPGVADSWSGWCDFDPTNNRGPGEDYVTLATGRDYSDVSPIRGVIHGGANHTLDVGVTVVPLDREPDVMLAPATAS